MNFKFTSIAESHKSKVDYRIMINRLHLFEFGDQRWLPSIFKEALTDILQFQVQEIYQPVAPKLATLIKQTNKNQITDLCSGASGPWETLIQQLQNEGIYPKVLLTDKFPNPKYIQQFNHPNIAYLEHPMDIFEIQPSEDSIYTIFTAFHHFNPKQAVQILNTLVNTQQPIVIFEFTQRRWQNIIGMLLSPILIFLTIPRLPLQRWQYYLFTYLFPIIPLIYIWDGMVSHCRTYTTMELKEMATHLKSNTYNWEIGVLKHQTYPYTITYLIGY